MRKGDKVFSTKYVLTAGITEETIDHHSDNDPAYVYVKRDDSWGGTMQLAHEGKDWHLTRDAAVKRAEEVRTRKIAALRKQITKLESLRFDT